MTNKTITAAYAGGYALKSTISILYIEATASVGGTGVTTSTLATIFNHGAVAASGNNVGISLSHGGLVDNGYYGGVISGAVGVEASGGFATVQNYKYITGVSYGIVLKSGGSVFNAPLDRFSGPGTTKSSSNVVTIYNGSGTVLNFGTIFTSYYPGIGAGSGVTIETGRVNN